MGETHDRRPDCGTDLEMADAVVASSLPADIGSDMLFRLPEWGFTSTRPTPSARWCAVCGPISNGTSHRQCAGLCFVWHTAEGALKILPVPLGLVLNFVAMRSAAVTAAVLEGVSAEAEHSPAADGGP
jgi:hypothetical protein